MAGDDERAVGRDPGQIVAVDRRQHDHRFGRRAKLHADTGERHALDICVRKGTVGEKTAREIGGRRKIRIAGVAAACQ
ncbi:hypothetical protein GCM10011611_36980 [Aliidongia dinghuensis]|uniref:Uncharacterized protein n=1 Tax=Aliidongia dinghuensis TaxID=1867774 RepID=A0A8J2YVF8_9PROT|nr:hypothetical protein GCM10011611_36980 [Aliidongia dinghuensis]